MDLFFIIVSLIYLKLHSIFLLGFTRSNSLKQYNSHHRRKVAIIIPALNEEKIIANCIKHLKKLKYDKELLEIILVNDKSTDKTKEIMLNETKGYDNFIVIDSNKIETSSLKGKANALNTAIKLTKADIIFTTDADCEVPENWLEETIKYYEGNTAMVCGFTMIKPGKNLFSKVQSLDWIYLLALASCSAGINKILSCLGNSLTFSKSAYIDIGGYEKVGFSVTEDLALMRTIDKDKRFKIKYPINPLTLVNTESCENLKDLYNQKRRWFRGGVNINFLGYILGLELYIMNFILIFGLFFVNPLLYLFLIFIKILSELSITIPIYRKLKIKKLIKYYPLFQIYFSVYGILLPLSFLFGKNINWKERKFRTL